MWDITGHPEYMWISWLMRMKMKKLMNLTVYHLANRVDFSEKEIMVMEGLGKLRILAIKSRKTYRVL
jgi:hypothetical protein